MTSFSVALLSPPFSTLSYALPPWLGPSAFDAGQRVAVPLGKGVRAGVIVGMDKKETSPQEKWGFQRGITQSLCPRSPLAAGGNLAPGQVHKAFSLKDILWPLEREALLAEWYRDLAAQIALRQTESLGRVLAAMLPAGLRSAQLRVRFFGEGKLRELRVRDLSLLPAGELAELGALWEAGRAEIRRPGRSPLDSELCAVALDPPWPVRPAAKAQTALLEYLHEHGALTRRRLTEALGKGAAATLSLLCGRGLVHIRPVDDAPTLPAIAPPAAEAFRLTAHQQAVFGPLRDALASGKAQTRLLFGITGSGKTAIYLELVREVLQSGRSALLLAPEVALALKLWGDAKASALAGASLHLFHGSLPPSARERAFHDLARHRAGQGSGPCLVVGTRSALLLPVDDVGLIVLDEEHDASFKQDEGFIYQAKEVAWYRAQKQRALLLLGSATPDVKSYYAAQEGTIPLHVLRERVGGGRLPAVRLVPLPKSRTGPLAPESLEALRGVVERGEQAVVLLNRRGYAPLMYCLACASVAKCPHCDISLAYHKGRERLLCHYCGHSVPFPSPCASCKGMRFLPMGEGTEKLEEHLGPLLPPGTGILRLDRDSTRRPGRMEDILAAFARKEASVLIGTQMLSKGHHFPDVTLAVVADADLGLNLPDYRATERTFQLLVQSSGRSGRGEKPGSVLIQTRNPEHYCWTYVRNADYEGFYRQELELRKRRSYPPFIRLSLIRISFAAEEEQGLEQVNALGALLRQKAGELGLTALGPAPAPLPFLQGRKRWHCLVKSRDWQSPRALYSAALAAFGKSCLRIRLDLDPVTML